MKERILKYLYFYSDIFIRVEFTKQFIFFTRYNLQKIRAFSQPTINMLFQLFSNKRWS